MEDGIERAGQFVARRDLIGNAGVADLRLGADDALRDGAWSREIGVRDLLGRQAADLAQRERDLGIGGQRRMAAGEDEPKAIVLERLLLEGDRVDRCFELPGELGDRRIERGRAGAGRRSP